MGLPNNSPEPTLPAAELDTQLALQQPWSQARITRGCAEKLER